MKSNSSLCLDEQKVVEIYLKLKSIPQTAKEFNCSATSIARILKNNNVKKDNPFGKLELNEQEVVNYYYLYSSVKMTAKRFNCCRNTISKILKRNSTSVSKLPSTFLSPKQLRAMALTER